MISGVHIAECVEPLKSLCYVDPTKSLTLMVVRPLYLQQASYSTGHEPAHVAFVGPSILTAAVTAHVFVSPSASLILAALRPACPPHGTLDHQELYGRYPCTLAWPRVRDAAKYFASNTATIDIYLNHCHIPGSSSFASLADAEHGHT
ncbi:hypothetical protein BC936DRAFT_144473 [Jimgerdemannia flammicorona]|uniref:DhaK domain-containing protein n=1 Tax=Jimgerdemannia flammicorona TaxID=994334 RepID=A0A432ZXT3_9FUNG|nr:hypothetical protein BC936DRAFT_144473 [Jimgerdemannia flammicorona]